MEKIFTKLILPVHLPESNHILSQVWICYTVFMGVRQKLEFRQKAVFAQSLQQTMKALELPILELRGLMEAELAENPALEEVAGAASAPATESPSSAASNPDEGPPTSPGDERETTSQESEGFEKPLPAKNETLSDFLLKQLRISADSETQLRLGELIIQNIDDNGYLSRSIEELAGENNAPPAEMESALKLVQTFDPPGIGARNLKECLLVQLKKAGDDKSMTYEIAENHLPDLANRDLERLCKKLKCSHEELAHCIEKIHALEPKPGRGFNYDEICYVVPDISIEERDDEFIVSVKEDALPLIRVNPVYRNMLKSKKVDEQTKEFIRERISRANDLIGAIQNRKRTLLKVVSLIAETQKEAVLEGVEKLIPLTLKEVAEKTGLHESTVSRIVANKYVQAPAGIFALKDLFSFGLKTTGGPDIASQRIKSKIQELIESEDKTKPLKDHEIADIVKEMEHTPLARRTIAKYREGMDIPPASQRKTR